MLLSSIGVGKKSNKSNIRSSKPKGAYCLDAGQHIDTGKFGKQKLRLASSHESWVQTTRSDRVLFADPGDKSFKSQTVTTMRSSTIPR
jgi:hypothetical protein